MQSRFIGLWSGVVEGSYNGNILVRINGFKNHLYGHAILRSNKGHRDLVKFSGEEKKANISEFSLIEYFSSESDVINPSE